MANVLGVCGNSDQAKAYINQGTRLLMKRGNFWGTVQMISACVFNECITWPRYVGTVLALNTCNRPLTIWNDWYAFVPFGPGGAAAEGFVFSRGLECHGNMAVDNYGTSPVFNQIPCGKNFYIRAYPQTRNDVGKKIVIFGIDSNGQTIRTKRADGTLQDGVELIIAVPFVSTSFQIREITRIVKEKTQGSVRLFQYDATNNVLLSCAYYEPSETGPDYRLSRVHHLQLAGCCACSNGQKTIKGLVKLQFVPVESDNDLVLISNLDALALIIQSVRERNAGHLEEANSLEASSIHDLNLELRDKFPMEQTPISVNPFGTALPVRHSIGRII